MYEGGSESTPLITENSVEISTHRNSQQYANNASLNRASIELQNIPLASPYTTETKEKGLELYARMWLWYIPVIAYNIFTLEFIEYPISCLPDSTGIKLKKFKFEINIKWLRHYFKRILQIGMVLLFSAQILGQFILFIVDAVRINSKRCCEPSTLNTDTTEEIMFASDFINSIVSLTSCYFIYANSNIFREFEIEFRNPATKSNLWVWKLPRGKGKFFSRIAVISAYTTVLILPMVMVASFNKLSWVNAYLKVFPDLLNASECPSGNQLKNTTTTTALKELFESGQHVYKVMSCAITIHWHICPVLACVVARYICKELEYQVDRATRRSTEYIINEWNKMKTVRQHNNTKNVDRPIIAFYDLTSKVRKGSAIAHYIATINIVAVIVILASLFSGYVDSSNNGYTQKLAHIAKMNDEIKAIIAIRTPFIYIYQFISVWLLSDAIISLNTKLDKFGDSILSDQDIKEILFTRGQGNEDKSLEDFKSELKQELGLVSQSRERFEIAFFGDFSISVFHTIIPFGVGAMIDFIVRAIDAMKYFCAK